MKKRIPTVIYRSVVLPFLLLLAVTSSAQYKISGTVLDNKERPVKGASVYLDNTLDGGTTDSLGIFSFSTSEKGNQSIVASEVSHETAGLPIVIAGDISGLVLHMKKNAVHDLDMVTITAGSFEASNDKSKTVLKPLDIVTTAGANADVVKAIEMLPGTQKTGTDNGMFVRGGDASEGAILVDEMVVQNAFFSGPPGMTTRSRFGAFQYQGVSFSSGGYSARYGQALSSVLELNSTDLADKSTVNLGVNMAGVYASGVKRWKNSSLDFGGSYNNTTPFFGLAKTNYDFYKAPEGAGANLRYAWKPNKNGIMKVSLNNSVGSSGIKIPNPFAGIQDPALNLFGDSSSNIKYGTNDQYYYSNASYRQLFKDKYSLYTAASYSLDMTDNKFGSASLKEQDHRAQYRLEGKDFITSRLTLLVGGEVQSYGISKNFRDVYKPEFTETIAAAYTEVEWTPINMLAIKPGLRYEHSALLNKDNIAPRFSMAVKTSDHSQVSLAGGMFFQDPDNMYLLAGLNHKPGMQQATHYIANWQYSKDDRILRLEGYYKNYTDLVREINIGYDPNGYRTLGPASVVDNSGHGYAQGLELFWRDKKSIKNVDYWISYSYIDTRRLYANYTALATPGFIADHNLNVVSKYFVEKWHTNFSATYSFASGRPYYNPTNSTFLGDRTTPYNNLALAVAYLHTFGKWFTVFYVSLDNVTDNHNIFGYRYAASGERTPILPPLYRSVFVGVNMSLTQFKKDEL
jgi:hypothetical protein